MDYETEQADIRPEPSEMLAVVAQNRVGRFVLPRQMIRRLPHMAMQFLSKVLVTRAEARLDLDGIEYIGYHPAFAPQPYGCAPPTYQLDHHACGVTVEIQYPDREASFLRKRIAELEQEQLARNVECERPLTATEVRGRMLKLGAGGAMADYNFDPVRGSEYIDVVGELPRYDEPAEPEWKPTPVDDRNAQPKRYRYDKGRRTLVVDG